MSDFIEGDHEGGEGSGGSRAWWWRAAARLTAGAAGHADRQVAQARHGVWAGAGSEPEKRPRPRRGRAPSARGLPVQAANGLVQCVADHGPYRSLGCL
jgi:hypothetical protein